MHTSSSSTSVKEFIGGCCGGCFLILLILGYFAGTVVCLYYSAKAWHDEKDADMSATGCDTAFNWNKFITIWSGIIVYSLFIQGKSAANGDTTFHEMVARVVILWLFGVGFGFGTYKNYYDICTSAALAETMQSIEVFMYFWLAVAGSLTVLSLLIGGVACVVMGADGGHEHERDCDRGA